VAISHDPERAVFHEIVVETVPDALRTSVAPIDESSLNNR
jgi:hypothetical protein